VTVRLNVTAASAKSTDTDHDDDGDADDADEWTVDCTALVDVDLACALCAPLVPAANSRQLMSTTAALVVCLTAGGALVALLVAVGVCCRRITSTSKHACTYAMCVQLVLYLLASIEDVQVGYVRPTSPIYTSKYLGQLGVSRS